MAQLGRIEEAKAEAAQFLAAHNIPLLGRMTARERLCSFLLERLRGRAVLIELPMSRIDIADYLGLTIETVSRTMSRLRAEGLIRTPSADIIEVIDLGRLQGMVQDRAAR